LHLDAMEHALPRAVAAALVLEALLGAPRALAAPTEAEALFQRGRQLMAAGQLNEACVALDRSHALDPQLGTLLNLADCQERTHRLASAYVAFNAAADWAARNKEAKREQVARQRAEALKPRLASVAVELPAAVEQAEASLWLAGAGAPLRRWQLNGPAQNVPVDPGRYELRVEAPGFQAAQVPLEVADAPGVKRVPVALTPVTAPPPPPPLVSEDGAPPEATPAVAGAPAGVSASAGSGSSKLGLAAAVTGGALAVAGGVGLGYCLSVNAAVQRQQPGGTDFGSPTVTRAQFATVRTLYPLSWAVAGVGLAAAGAGLGLLLRGPAVTVTPLPGGVAVGAGGSF
jgi:hypothetical protein